jgi:hypothetical protein
VLPRPVERPGQEPWVESNRVCLSGGGLEVAAAAVAKVEHHPGEFSLRVGFIVINLRAGSCDVVRFNTRDRVALDQGRQACNEDHAARWLSVPIEQVRLWLIVIAEIPSHRTIWATGSDGQRCR